MAAARLRDALRRWFDSLGARPAVQRGFKLGDELRRQNKGREAEIRRVLFGQRARRA